MTRGSSLDMPIWHSYIRNALGLRKQNSFLTCCKYCAMDKGQQGNAEFHLAVKAWLFLGHADADVAVKRYKAPWAYSNVVADGHAARPTL